MKSPYLIKIFCFLVIAYFAAQDAFGQTTVCDDTFDYELVETDGGQYSIQLAPSFTGDYLFKLFDITGKEFLVEEKTSKDFINQKVIFSGLNKQSIFLIQTISLDSKCTFTIGGMEGITFEN